MANTKTVTASTLNLRASGSKNGKIIVRLNNGQSVNVVEVKGTWSRVTTTVSGTNYEGWVANEYLANVVQTVAVKELPWIAQARKYLGLREVPGTKHNPTIVSWWSKIGAHFRDDETPWCAGFVGGVFEEIGITSTRSAAARSFLKFGTKLNGPVYGAVVIFWRGNPGGGSGHVGFVVGKDKNGNIMVLGGNQSDAVNIKPFGTNRVLGYVWPTGHELLAQPLPVLTSDGKVSTNEA